MQKGMIEFMKRPAAVLGFSFFAALYAASFLPVNMILALSAFGIILFLAGLLVRSVRSNTRLMVVMLAVVTAFSSYASVYFIMWQPLQPWDGRDAELMVEVMDYPNGNNIEVRVVSGELPKGTKIRLWISGNEKYPEPFDRLTGKFLISVPQERRRLVAGGLSAIPSEYGEVGLELARAEDDFRPMMLIVGLRRHIRMTMMSRPEIEQTAALLCGLTFGYTDDIPSEVVGDFRTVGVSHLLAVSGLQTTMIMQILIALLGYLKINRRIASVVASVGVLGFMALTGFSASIMRAGLMSIIMAVGMMLNRQYDGLSSLGLTMLIITAVDPFAVHDVGLQLSFAATLGIMLLYQPMQRIVAKNMRKRESGRFLKFAAVPVDMACLTVAASIPTLPVLFVVFKQISVVSPVANVLMVNPALVATLLAGFGVIIEQIPFFGPVASLSFRLADLAARWLVWIASKLSLVPYASLPVGDAYLLVWLFGSIIVIMLGIKWLGTRKGVRVASILSVIMLLLGVLANGIAMRGVTEITVVGGDAAAVILRRNNMYGVIIAGNSDLSDDIYYTAMDGGVREIDFVLFADAPDGDLPISGALKKRTRVRDVIAGGGHSEIPLRSFNGTGQTLVWDAGEVAIWDDITVARFGDWIRILIGDTRIMICPSGGNAAELSGMWRQNHVVIFRDGVPRHSSLLESAAGVLACDEEDRPYLVKALPQCTYPIRTTASDSGRVILQTRGRSDVRFTIRK